MAKFRVYGNVYVCVCIEVEADDIDDAKEVADNQFHGLDGYAGNGGVGKLVGTSQDNEWVEVTEGPPDWDYVEAVQ